MVCGVVGGNMHMSAQFCWDCEECCGAGEGLIVPRTRTMEDAKYQVVGPFKTSLNEAVDGFLAM